MGENVFLMAMATLNSNYQNNIFNPKNEEQVKLWYGMLKDADTVVFKKAIHLILCNERFAPNIATIREYIAKVSAPIETDDTEAWGRVTNAIHNYGYYRAEEALQSLPQAVQEAVKRVGGFKMICESENADVIRGQFNKTMTEINNRIRETARTPLGLKTVVEQLQLKKTEYMAIEARYERDTDQNIQQGIQSVEDIMREIGLREVSNE